MRIAILVVLAVIAMVAAADNSDEEPREVTDKVGVTLEPCHPGVDEVLVHVIPIPENAVRLSGWFKTTNTLFFLKDLSMLPSGLNRLEVQSICRGMTGVTRSFVIDLKRPPAPPRIGFRRAPANTNSPVPIRTARLPVELPPLPPGMGGTLPLPGSPTNQISYHDQQMMKAYYAKPGRRSQ